MKPATGGLVAGGSRRLGRRGRTDQRRCRRLGARYRRWQDT